MSTETQSHPPSNGNLRSTVAAADFFERVGYSTVWEDERIISDALKPRADERVMSITSGGDFSLQFLMHDVGWVHSVDLNQRQNFLLNFKIAAARNLDHGDLWRVLGLSPCRKRLELYQRLRPILPAIARRYWDNQKSAVRKGILYCGKQDRYLMLIGRLLRVLQGNRTIEKMFTYTGGDEQRTFFERDWSGRAWRLITATLLNRRALDHFFHKDHFRYARQDQHPVDAMREQAERVLRDVPLQDNFYLHWMLYGSYPSKENCPAWLRESNFEKLRANLDRLTVTTDELERFIFALDDNSIDCFNFSNIFDWVSKEDFIRLMRQVVRVSRPGARLCYWTNAVNTRRELADAAAVLPKLVEETSLADRLFAVSRTPGYSSCTVGSVGAM